MGSVTDPDLGAVSDAALATRLTSAGLGVATAATVAPLIDGVAAIGSSTKYARQDHVHPTDTARAPAWTSTDATGLTAAGSSRTDALALDAWNKVQVIGTAAASTGVVFPASAANNWAIVQNGGANTIKVYFNGSETINGTAGSTGISVAAGKVAFFATSAAGKVYGGQFA